METFQDYAKKPWVIALVGFVVGAIFGLVVLGWWVWPVQWTNATPAHLSAEWRSDYLHAAITSFGQNGDVAKAQKRFKAVGEDGDKLLSEISLAPEGLSSVLIGEFKSVVGSQAPAQAPGQTPAATGQQPAQPGEATETAPESDEKKSSSIWPVLLGSLCVLLLVLVAFLAYMFIFRKRKTSGAAPSAATQAAEARQHAAFTEYKPTDEEAPVAQFMASYKFRDDLFDDSFSIDSPSGEFLGECGVGISETIGVGEHKKVTAFEVWLFDKNDIQTITKVLMSRHAYDDLSVRQRLEAKGEPILLEKDKQIILETQTLQLVARVAEMTYGDSAMPEESYFDQMLIELAIWTKP